MYEKVVLHEADPKICKCSEIIIPLCGGNEENVLFLIDSLGGVTQQETHPKRVHGCGRWASAWTELLVRGSASTLSKAPCAIQEVQKILNTSSIISRCHIFLFHLTFVFLNKIKFVP